MILLHSLRNLKEIAQLFNFTVTRTMTGDCKHVSERSDQEIILSVCLHFFYTLNIHDLLISLHLGDSLRRNWQDVG